MNNKEAFIETLRAKIDQWDAEIDRLSVKAAMVEADSKEEYYKQIAELKTKRAEIEEKGNQLQQAGEDAWGDLKAGLDLAFEAMRDALKSASSRFR